MLTEILEESLQAGSRFGSIRCASVIQDEAELFSNVSSVRFVEQGEVKFDKFSGGSESGREMLEVDENVMKTSGGGRES